MDRNEKRKIVAAAAQSALNGIAGYLAVTHIQDKASVEARKAGMAAFRAKMLKAHTAMLNGGDPNTLKRGKVGEAARKYHADMIESIKAAQRKYGEAE